MWNRHADGLRSRGTRVAEDHQGRDAEGLFDVGDKIDKACESCHLEYRYPGDKKAVLENQQKTVTYDKPEK